jgi:ComF family protein
MNAIHWFKYNGEISVGKTLGRFNAEFEYNSFSLEGYSLILPVPLHHRRLKERGFNQSVILAREIAIRYSVCLDFGTLKRTIHTKPQTGLGKEQRSTNVKGSFIITDSEKIDGERVVLIDDVYTTGSTVRECARKLLENGVEEVAVLTLARAV